MEIGDLASLQELSPAQALLRAKDALHNRNDRLALAAAYRALGSNDPATREEALLIASQILLRLRDPAAVRTMIVTLEASSVFENARIPAFVQSSSLLNELTEMDSSLPETVQLAKDLYLEGHHAIRTIDRFSGHSFYEKLLGAPGEALVLRNFMMSFMNLKQMLPDEEFLNWIREKGLDEWPGGLKSLLPATEIDRILNTPNFLQSKESDYGLKPENILWIFGGITDAFSLDPEDQYLRGMYVSFIEKLSGEWSFLLEDPQTSIALKSFNLEILRASSAESADHKGLTEVKELAEHMPEEQREKLLKVTDPDVFEKMVKQQREVEIPSIGMALAEASTSARFDAVRGIHLLGTKSFGLRFNWAFGLVSGGNHLKASDIFIQLVGLSKDREVQDSLLILAVRALLSYADRCAWLKLPYDLRRIEGLLKRISHPEKENLRCEYLLLRAHQARGGATRALQEAVRLSRHWNLSDLHALHLRIRILRRAGRTGHELLKPVYEAGKTELAEELQTQLFIAEQSSEIEDGSQREIAELLQKLKEFESLPADYQFNDLLPHLCDLRFKSSGGRQLLDDTRKSFADAEIFMSRFVGFLSSGSWEGVVRRREGVPIDAKVTGASRQMIIVDLGFGPNELEISKLAPDWILEVAHKGWLSTSIKLPESGWQPWVEAASFAYLTNQPDAAEKIADKILDKDPESAKRWRRIKSPFLGALNNTDPLATDADPFAAVADPFAADADPFAADADPFAADADDPKLKFDFSSRDAPNKRDPTELEIMVEIAKAFRDTNPDTSLYLIDHVISETAKDTSFRLNMQFLAAQVSLELGDKIAAYQRLQSLEVETTHQYDGRLRSELPFTDRTLIDEINALMQQCLPDGLETRKNSH